MVLFVFCNLENLSILDLALSGVKVEGYHHRVRNVVSDTVVQARSSKKRRVNDNHVERCTVVWFFFFWTERV